MPTPSERGGRLSRALLLAAVLLTGWPATAALAVGAEPLVLRIRADAPAFDRACLAQQRMPIGVRAVATMQTPASAAALGIDG